MFDKIITLSINPDNIDILDNEILKVASDNSILDNVRFDPNRVYAIVRGVSAGEYWGDNNNTDFFEEIELLGGNFYGYETGYKTFLDGNVFKNHKNKAVEHKIGDVHNVQWDDDMKAVMLLISVDKTLEPTIAKGLLTKTITDVSMGCKVHHVVCSICGKKAMTKIDYCEHLSDRSLRKKILSDGKKVYEINKGPKFHDISVVVRGADQTAKASKVIDGAVASKNQIEKAASDQEKMVRHLERRKPIIEFDATFEKIASELGMLKTADIEKQITGDIVSIVSDDLVKEALDKSEDVMEILRLFYTDYMEEGDIKKIVEKIMSISSARSMKPMSVFKTLLRTAELSGIELTPLEFASIAAKLKNKETDFFDMAQKLKPQMNHSAIKAILQTSRGFEDDGLRISLPSVNLDLEKEIFDRILSPMMSSRSSKRPYAIKRIVKILNDDRPESNNLHHWLLPTASKADFLKKHILRELMNDYTGYQNERVEILLNGDIDKFASVIDGTYAQELKTAMEKRANATNIQKAAKKGPWKSLAGAALLYPVVSGYSKYQQSKINEGRRVGSFNRYIAENPENAWFLSVLGKRYVPKAVNKSGDMVGQIFKKAYDAEYLGFLKHASDDSFDPELSEIMVFSSPRIDKKASELYSDSQLGTIKLASEYLYKGDESTCDDLLQKESLSQDDIHSFLKIAREETEQFVKEKANPSMLRNVAQNALEDSLLNPKVGPGFGAMLPGSIVDGILLEKAFSHFNKNNNVNKEVPNV